MKTRFLILLALVLGTTGCGGEAVNPDDSNPDVVTVPGKEDYVAMPFMTYRAAKAAAGQFSLLVVTDNGFFHREAVVNCTKQPCDPIAVEGMPLTSRSGKTNYVRFEDWDGNLIDRYAWTYSSNTLKLRKVGTTKWQTLTVSQDAWCRQGDDCDAQQLDPPCAGTWGCQSQVCTRSCDYTACSQAGGSCGAASACTNGTVGDAKLYPCQSSKVCCLPANTQPTFDPVSTGNRSQAFSAAHTEAAKTLSTADISFVTLQGTPTKLGSSYAGCEFTWDYVFVASVSNQTKKVITVTYPGWTSKSSTGQPMGAYLPENLFTSSVKLSFAEILAHATAAGVTLQSCALNPGAGTNAGFVDLQGTFGPGGVTWYWEFACAGASALYHFDAGTGAQK